MWNIWKIDSSGTSVTFVFHSLTSKKYNVQLFLSSEKFTLSASLWKKFLKSNKQKERKQSLHNQCFFIIVDACYRSFWNKWVIKYGKIYSEINASWQVMFKLRKKMHWDNILLFKSYRNVMSRSNYCFQDCYLHCIPFNVVLLSRYYILFRIQHQHWHRRHLTTRYSDKLRFII